MYIDYIIKKINDYFINSIDLVGFSITANSLQNFGTVFKSPSLCVQQATSLVSSRSDCGEKGFVVLLTACTLRSSYSRSSVTIVPPDTPSDPCTVHGRLKLDHDRSSSSRSRVTSSFAQVPPPPPSPPAYPLPWSVEPFVEYMWSHCGLWIVDSGHMSGEQIWVW